MGLWAALFPLEICLFGGPGGGSRGVLGRLGGSRGILGEPGVSREAFWTVLGPSWGRLGPSWGRLGGVLGCLGRQDESEKSSVMTDEASRAEMCKNLQKPIGF